MSTIITEKEVALLTINARRLLRYTREAEAKGEEYHLLTPLETSQSGLRVRLRWVADKTSPTGYGQEVDLMEHPSFSDTELLQAAQDVLQVPPVLLRTTDKVRTYGKAP